MAWNDIVKAPDVNANTLALGLNMQNRGIQQTADSLTQLGDSIKQRARNNAMKELLNDYSKMDMSDPNAMRSDLFSASSRLFQNDAQIDPLQQLGLVSSLTAPAYAERDYQTGRSDRAFDEGIAYLNATKTSPKGYGMISDDMGNFYQYNKDDGSYKLVQSASNGINPKLVTLKAVNSRDPQGVETTSYIPFNKMTGQPINSGSSVSTGATGAGIGGVKYPIATDTQKGNKEALESVLSLVNNMQIPTAEQSGQIDSRIDDVKTWLNIDTPDTKAAAKFDSDLGNLVTAFGTAQVKGVLSDKDTKYIEDQMPSRRYSPENNRVRMDNIKRKINEAVDRWNKNNPYNPIEINRGENQTTVKSVPALEDLVPIGDGLYRMPDGRVIRKKAQ